MLDDRSKLLMKALVERYIADGQPVFVELAPVDPRSLMQGDYMQLNFRLPGDGSHAVRAAAVAPTAAAHPDVERRGPNRATNVSRPKFEAKKPASVAGAVSVPRSVTGATMRWSLKL